MQQDNFFAQSYEDALNDYIYSCSNTKVDRWDWVVLTAANGKQAESYRIQIENRRRENRLPKDTQFVVIPDYKGQRIGSGGATFNVIRHIEREVGSFSQVLNKKILVIHSGGDSRRIPQYSACGKLFAPVPRMLPNGYVSTIFDELLIAATDIPNRCANGMMIFPSDTELLFNSLQLDLLSCDAAGLSIKVPVLEGQDHGVFVQGESSKDHRNRNVAKFLHKQSEALLRENRAVDSSNQVDVDTGCIWLSNKVISALWGLISDNDEFNLDKFEAFVNPKVCLNFYADFVYPLAEESTLDEFQKETPENGYSDELKACRESLWKALHGFKLSLVKMIPARYIHFGMTHEMYDLFVNDIANFKYLKWDRRLVTNGTKGTIINGFVTNISEVKDSVYIEDSRVINSVVEEGAILSNVDVKDITVPAGVVLSGLMLSNGKYVCRIYGKNDNPKASADAPFLGGTVSKFVNNMGVSKKDIWGNNTASIWNAKLYPECDSMEEAVRFALFLYKVLHEEIPEEEKKEWLNANKYSLNDSFRNADVVGLVKRKSEISNAVKIQKVVDLAIKGADLSNISDMIDADKVNISVEELYKTALKAEFPVNMRLCLACADICKFYKISSHEQFYEKYEDEAYKIINDVITRETFDRFGTDQKSIKIKKDEVTVELPVRINFCGSPSDAAPYCLEHGGTMVDGALLLRGKKPIKVTVRKISEDEVRFGSLDQSCADRFTEIKSLRKCNDPYDPYALHKAVLVAAGIIPYDISGITLIDLCRDLGGGFEILTEADVPKGSGLGTSSIIAAAAVKAVNEVCGIEVTNEKIYAQVFLVEQLMTTGGGWQDQVGGLTEGIKYFTSLPGKYQDIKVEHLQLSEKTLNELNERFVLVFSGQRRLARNVLREEMNQCIRNNSKALKAVKKIQEYCACMRYYLMKGDITSFAHYITAQFELVKKLDKGASNTCIEYIFDVCGDLIEGKSICGAGGGGFLQIVLKKGVSKEMLKRRIQDEFIDCGVEVWDCKLI